VNFTGNASEGSGIGFGGAIENYSDGKTKFINSEVKFIGNISTGSMYGLGGAISASDGHVYFIDSNVSFIGNEASTYGGAILGFTESRDSNTITFEASNRDIKLTFKDNKADGKLNDIHLGLDLNPNAGQGSDFINFDANGYGITLDNGIIITGSGTVNKNGSGALIFGGESEIRTEFKVNEGSIVFSEDAEFKGHSLKNSGLSVIDMQNERANNITVNNLQTDGTLKIDILENGGNDSITAGAASIGGNLYIRERVGIYKNKEYNIIITTQSQITGQFAYISGNPAFTFKQNTDDPNILKVIVNGRYASEFEKIKNLTYNQNETARALDQ
jgi:predicted outer membrane repeat protein